jgi:hypothetical protein
MTDKSLDLEAAHKLSNVHRSSLEQSDICGCFYCLDTYQHDEIEEWIDRDLTALCPKCGIDSVLGSASGLPITKEFLKKMQDRWFSRKTAKKGVPHVGSLSQEPSTKE